jgi:uncharacterized protein (TIGR02246 family)
MPNAPGRRSGNLGHEDAVNTSMNDEQQIRELVVSWMRATKAGDTETVLGLMTDDVVFLVPGQAPMIGKAAFLAHLPRPEAHLQIDGHSEIREIRVVGDFAFLWTSLSIVVTVPGAAPVTRSGDSLSILRKDDGKWRLARDANLLAPVSGPYS